MTRFGMKALCVAAAGLMALVSMPAAAQISGGGSRSDTWGPGAWMSSALDNIVGKASLAAQDYSYGLDRDRLCLLGAYVEPGEALRFTWTFNEGEQLLFIGGGDDDVTDLDLALYREGESSALVSDVEVDATPIITYTIPRSGKYTLKMNLFAAERNSFCGVALMVRGDRAVRLESINQAAANFMAIGDNIADNRGAADFPVNRWSLWGAVMTGRETQTLTGISCSGDNYTVAGASNDTSEHDIDVRVNRSNGSELDSDVLADGIPIANFSYNGTVEVEMIKADSGGEAFAVYGLLRTAR